MKLRLLSVVFGLVVPLAACNGSSNSNDSQSKVQSPISQASPSDQASPSAQASPSSPDQSPVSYTAKFPGKPNEQKQAGYIDKANKRSYQIVTVDLPVPGGVKLNDSEIQQDLDKIRDSIVKPAGATLKKETKISQSKYPGREFTMSLPKGGSATVRIFINPDNLKAYQAIVAAQDNNLDFPEAKAFLDSVSQGSDTAKFPGKPNEQTQIGYVDNANKRLYRIMIVDLPVPAGVKRNDSNIQQDLDNIRDSMVKPAGATLKKETKISQSGSPGREFSMTLPNGAAAKVRIFINPDNLKAYQAIVAAKDGKTDFPEAKAFLDSVAVGK